MNNFELIHKWLKQCPELNKLWVVSSLLEDKKNVLLPAKSENMYNVKFTKYADGGKKYVFEPREPYFFDVDIICYRENVASDNDYNFDTQSAMQSVCDWVINQQNTGAAPGGDIYQIECLTPIPFIRNQYQSESDPNIILVDYAVTVRFYTPNPAEYRVVMK